MASLYFSLKTFSQLNLNQMFSRKFLFFPQIFFEESKKKATNYTFGEHGKEFNQRIKLSLILSAFCFLLILINVKYLTKILELPVRDVKFFQLSPNEYFFSSLKLSLYSTIIVGFPFHISQIIFFLAPGFSYREQKIVFSLIILSIILFLISLGFTFFALLPAALNFFLNYNEGILEPFWSFTEYFDFSTTLFLGTAIVFQLPILQVILSVCNFTNTKKMKKNWKYIVLFSTILGAVITPSTDPITQLILSSVILVLYGLGIFLTDFYIKK